MPLWYRLSCYLRDNYAWVNHTHSCICQESTPETSSHMSSVSLIYYWVKHYLSKKLNWSSMNLIENWNYEIFLWKSLLALILLNFAPSSIWNMFLYIHNKLVCECYWASVGVYIAQQLIVLPTHHFVPFLFFWNVHTLNCSFTTHTLQTFSGSLCGTSCRSVNSIIFIEAKLICLLDCLFVTWWKMVSPNPNWEPSVNMILGPSCWVLLAAS